MPCPSMWPNWFGLYQNELVRSKLWFSTKINHIWTWPIHFGRDQIIMVKSKSIWSDQNDFWINQNCFGHIKGQGIGVIHSFFWKNQRHHNLPSRFTDLYWWTGALHHSWRPEPQIKQTNKLKQLRANRYCHVRLFSNFLFTFTEYRVYS